MRPTAFQRDYRDLHGEEPPEATQVFEARPILPPPRRLRWAYKMPSFVRIAVGSVALFWLIALGTASVIMVGVFCVFVYAAITAPSLPYS